VVWRESGESSHYRGHIHGLAAVNPDDGAEPKWNHERSGTSNPIQSDVI
jgi:hypothetical protein